MPDPSSHASKTQFAIKTALSLTLAYMLPMALGWPQPQTAATTVMLIAATGMVSDSLQKGVLRVLGTVVGAVIGLSLIALFPQDRMLYLFSVSVAVSALLYLYNAYQGDSTLFMLAAVVTLMVFNGGDADGAFLYGVDRTLLTAFGVLVYTLVASLLWPVKVQDNTQLLAAGVSGAQGEAFAALVSSKAPEPGSVEDILKNNEQFQAHYVATRDSEEQILSYRAEWDTIATSFEQVDEILIPALQTAALKDSDYQKYILNYAALVANTQLLFDEIRGNWAAGERQQRPELIEISIASEDLPRESHLFVAAITARADLLMKLQRVLLNLWRTTNSLLFDERGFTATAEFRGKPSFVWLDRENVKTAIRAFISFWIATSVWLIYNPPGGFMFVTLSTALVVLISYTPVTPKLLYILFTLGFLFAVPAYIFLLPQMTHWLELAIFLFSYAFIGFYVFSGPLSIFFLLGLMTLGIQNTMAYNFDVILILILLFYMVCTSLVVSVYFPFTSKPQLLYISFKRRFFNSCEKIITAGSDKAYFGKNYLLKLRLGTATALNAKLSQWGPMIDAKYYPANTQEKMSEFNLACSVLLEQLKVLAHKSHSFDQNALIGRARMGQNGEWLAGLVSGLAKLGQQEKITADFRSIDSELGSIESRLDTLLGDNYLETYSRPELTEFYLYLNLQAAIFTGIVQCQNALQALDWDQLKGKKF